MIFSKKKEQELVVVPFNICGFKAGDRVDTIQFVTVLLTHIERLEDELDDERMKNERLNRMLDDIRSDIDEFYRPRSAYELNGVTPIDF